MRDESAAIDKPKRSLGPYEADNKKIDGVIAELIQSVQGTRMPIKWAANETFWLSA